MQTFNSYTDAAASLPADVRWSSSFGYPGEGGYSEFHRTTDGRRFVIENGKWDAIAPFAWTVHSVEA